MDSKGQINWNMKQLIEEQSVRRNRQNILGQTQGTSKTKKKIIQSGIVTIQAENKLENIKMPIHQQQNKIDCQNSENVVELNPKEKIPPFAQICADIISKIAEYPKKQQLQKSSLVDQICVMIQKFELEHRGDSVMQLKAKTLKKLFRDGVQRNNSFRQEKVKQGATKNGKIIFHPTHTVTGQIMRQLVHYKKLSKYNVFFGHHSIGKTYAYYLYHELSNLFIAETLECGKDMVKIICQKRNINHIPKLFYWSMQIKDNLNKQKQISQYRKLFFEQCSQIPKNILNLMYSKKVEYLTSFVEQICQFYNQKGIMVDLLVDQINQIAAIFRQYYKKRSDISQNDKKKYQSAGFINSYRHSLSFVHRGFSRVIFNSPVNCKNLVHYNDSISLYERLMQKIVIVRDYPHQKQIDQYQILYLQIMKFDSSVWSLVDTIIFQMKRNKQQFKTKDELNQLRSEIFQYLKKRNNSSLTFLRIREIIKQLQEYLNLSVPELVLILKYEIQRTQKIKCLKALKGLKKQQSKTLYKNTLNVIYQQSKQMKLSQENDALSQKCIIKRQFRKCLSFLDHPYYCKENIKPQHFLIIDRNLFIRLDWRLDGSSAADNYLFDIQNYAIKSFSHWETLKETEIQQITRDIFRSFQGKIYQKLFLIQYKQPPAIVLTLLPQTKMIQLIKCELQSQSSQQRNEKEDENQAQKNKKSISCLGQSESQENDQN